MTKIKTAEQQISENLIAKVVAGSHAYGTNIATSDDDYRGIFVADAINIRTPLFPIREATDVSEEDTKVYELCQFVKLMLNCNPNILEIVWSEPDLIVYDSEEFQYLRSRAPEFLSKKAAFTFTGYAISQLKRIKGHNKWITQQQNAEAKIFAALRHKIVSIEFVREHIDLNMLSSQTRDTLNTFVNVPATDGINFLFDHDINLITLHAPYHEHYVTVVSGPRDMPSATGVKLHPLTSAGHEGTIYEVYSTSNPNNKMFDSYHRIVVDSEFIPDRDARPIGLVKFNKQLFTEHADKRSKFRNWKENRNETRFQLEDTYGYDTKHASHIVRLMNMGTEILTDGIVHVRRPDAELLKDIRAGKWTYNELLEFAEEKDELIRNQLYHTTTLPKAPNLESAAEMIMLIQDMFWSKKKDEQ